MPFPRRMQDFNQNPMAEFDAQSVEGAMREDEPMGMPEMPGMEMPMMDPMMDMMGAPDNSQHAVDVPLPSPEDSPTRYNMGMPPAKLDPNQLMQSDYEDPRILGDLLTSEMATEAGDSEAYQQGAMDDAMQDGKQNKKLFGM